MEWEAKASGCWALDFGCSPHELRPARTHVQAHTANLASSTGIWVLVAGSGPLVSMPADVLATHGERAKSWTSGLISDERLLLNELAGLAPGRVGRVMGPAPIHYGSAASLDLHEAERAVAFTPETAIVHELRDACGEAWEDGGSELSELSPGVPLFGAFDDAGQLAALASYRIWNQAIAHISIITRPACRGRGFGRAAVARAAQYALGAGLVPQYRTLRSNAASIVVAKRLGFVEYGFSVYVRMQAA